MQSHEHDFFKLNSQPAAAAQAIDPAHHQGFSPGILVRPAPPRPGRPEMHTAAPSGHISRPRLASLQVSLTTDTEVGARDGPHIDAQTTPLRTLVSRASPTRLYLRSSFACCVLGMLALGLVPILSAAGITNASSVVCYAVFGTCVGLAVLILCLWPCASHAQRPVVSDMMDGRGLLVEWAYSTAEWQQFVDTELGPRGVQRQSAMCTGICLVVCVAPVFAFVVAGMVALDNDGGTFSSAILITLPVAIGMFLLLSLLRCLRVRQQHAYATSHPGHCAVFTHGLVFLGSLYLWGFSSIWLGSRALVALECSAPPTETTDGSSACRILSFVLVATRGRDAGRQTSHVRVPMPAALSEDAVVQLATQLGVPLRHVQREAPRHQGSSVGDVRSMVVQGTALSGDGTAVPAAMPAPPTASHC